MGSLSEYLSACGAGEVPICDMDSEANVLIGPDGRAFVEVETNIWVDRDRFERVAYLGTGRHGGGIVLRPMFVKTEGVWKNVTTGREAPAGMFESYDIDMIDRMGEIGDMQATGVRVLEDLDWKRRCEAFEKLCASFSWCVELRGVYDKICSAVAEVVRCDEAHLHIMTRDGTQFVRFGSFPDSRRSYRGSDSKSSAVGRAQWMVKMRKPIIMDYEHPHLADAIPREAVDEGLKSAVSIPVQWGDSVLGMLSIVYRVRTSWSEEDIEFLLMVGRIVGVFVQRAQDTKKSFELQMLDERKRLSGEIHDNVSSLISALSVSAAAAIASFDEGDLATARKDLSRLEAAAGETIRILRDEMFSLRIPLEQTDGLMNGIEDALERFQANWGIKADLVVVPDGEPVVVPLQVSLQLTRILNECLSNVIKHADASHVRVTVENARRNLVMAVSDDGRGFDPASVDPSRFGLKIMGERAAAAGGTLRVETGETGTTVRVDVVKRTRSR